jgi:ABC-2 type transport system permease protein
MGTLSKIWAFVKRDFLQNVSYRLNFAVSIVGVLLSCLTFHFLSKLVPPTSVPMLSAYGGEYFPFVLIGIAFYSFLGVGLQSLADSISRAQMTGTLEALLVTPTSLTTVILASTVFSFLFAAGRVVMYLAFGALFFGVRLGQANLPAAAVVFALSITAFTAIGMLSAAFVMVFKKGSPPGWVFGGISTLFGGVIFPIELLPAWIRPVSRVLPITYALDGMRSTVLAGAGLGEVRREVAMLALFAALLLPVGVAAFSFAVRRTKRTGTRPVLNDGPARIRSGRTGGGPGGARPGSQGSGSGRQPIAPPGNCHSIR